MKNNKKSLFELGMFLITGFLLIIIAMFVYIFIFEANKTYLISPMLNISKHMYNTSFIDSQTYNFISSQGNNYDKFNIIPDYLTLLLIGLFYIYALGTAFVSKKQGTIEFFANLTIINIILLFIMSIFTTIMQWIWNNFYVKLLTNLHYSLHFIHFFVFHSNIIFFLMFMSLVLINKIEIFGMKKSNDMQRI